MFSLSDSSRYLWNSYVYLGKNGINNETNKQLETELDKSGAVVPKLVSEILNRGWKLFVENWYPKEKSFNYLYDNGTVACGTARWNRMQLPNSFKKEPLSMCLSLHRRNDKLLFVTLTKRRYFLFTMYDRQTRSTGKRIKDNVPILKLKPINIYHIYWVLLTNTMLWSAITLASEKLISGP